MMQNLRAIFFCLLIATIAFSACKKEDDGLVPGGSITPRSFLTADDYDVLTVELLSVDGFEPATATVDALRDFLEARLNKPAGLQFVSHSIPAPGGAPYSVEEVRDIERANREEYADGRTLAACVLFADGDYAENSGNAKTLGIAYGATSMCIFEETIREYSGGIGEPPVSALETTVLLHEFGHVLGLVNNGTDMQAQHQDAAHGKHCDEESCLMYYTAETSDIVGNLLGGSVPDLDAQCIADLQANGGK